MHMNLPTATGLFRAGSLAAMAFIAACLLCMVGVMAPQPQAHAVTKAEQTAYNRSVKAINDYKNQPQAITVKVSDLHLSYKQICAVYDRVAWDGRYFWVNPFGKPAKTTKSITYNCIYTDAQITKMRTAFNAKMKSAMSWAPAGMASVERIHMLHDWLMKRGGVWTKDGNIDHKLAYGAIVLGKGDCQSFTLAMNALLNQAGFTTDVAYIDTASDDHAWTRVKLGGKWYNIDATWDNTYTRNYPSYWSGGICHMYFMVNDYTMEHGSPDNFNDFGHPGFVAANKNTSKSYATKYLTKNWSKTNRKWMKVGSTFKFDGITYKVGKGHTVSVQRVKKSAKSITLPATAAYRGHSYKVTGIKAGAFSGAKAKTLVLKTSKLTKAGVKGGLKYSKVKKVKVNKASVSKSVYKKYKKYFKKKNSGKKVKLTYK